MGKVESKLKFYLYRCLSSLESKEEKSDYLKALIKAVKKELRVFDEKEWQNNGFDLLILNSFNYIEKNSGDICIIVVVFLIISQRRSIIRNFSLRYINEISVALDSQEIFPNAYLPYLNFFINDDVFAKFVALEQDEMEETIYSVVAHVPYDDFVRRDYSTADKMIKKCKRISTLFEECHSFREVAHVLEEYVDTSYEKKLIAVFRNTDKELDRDAWAEFTEKVIELEESELLEKDDLVRAVLKMVFNFYYRNAMGLNVLEKGDEETACGELCSHVREAIKKAELFIDDEEENAKNILRAAKRSLRNYDKAIFEERGLDKALLAYYEVLPDEFIEYIEKLAIFILVSEDTKDLDVQSIEEFIVYLGHALVEYEVPVENYQAYRKLLMAEPIYGDLMSLEEAIRLDAIIELVRETDLHCAYETQRETALQILEYYTGKAHSPLFNRNFELLNIYNVLKSIMSDSNYKQYFTASDWQVLESILDLNKLIDEEGLSDLARRISRIEVRYDMRVVKAVKSILCYISIYDDFVKKGLKVLEVGKKF